MSASPTSQQIKSGQFSVSYDFASPVTATSHRVAEAVSDLVAVDDLAPENDGGTEYWAVRLSVDLLDRVAAYLGDDWDRRSVLAAIRHCAFAVLVGEPRA